MKNKTLIPLFGAIVAGLAVFAYLRIVGDHTPVAKPGLFLIAAAGAAAGLLVGRKMQAQD